MAIFSLLIAFIVFASIIAILSILNTRNQADFQIKQNQIEKNIVFESKRLEKQKEKELIADEFKQTINKNNEELFIKIEGLNHLLFEEIGSKNKYK